MRELKKENSKILFLSLLVFLGFFVLFLRIAYIQLIGRTEYVKRIAERFPKVALVDIPTYRGSIKDRNGNDLAISIPTISVYAFPKYVQNKEELASRLSAPTGVPIKKDYDYARLSKDWGLPILIVARAGLGTINHTFLTYFYAKSMGLTLLGIVMNGFEGKDVSERTNARIVQELTGIKPLELSKIDGLLLPADSRRALAKFIGF